MVNIGDIVRKTVIGAVIGGGVAIAVTKGSELYAVKKQEAEGKLMLANAGQSTAAHDIQQSPFESLGETTRFWEGGEDYRGGSTIENPYDLY